MSRHRLLGFVFMVLFPPRKAAQQAQDPRAVVAAHQVHEAVIEGGGIVFLLAFHQAADRPGVAAVQKEVNQDDPQGVVHHAVYGVPQAVRAHLPVGDLMAGVLPDLAQDHRVVLDRADGLTQAAQIVHRQFVRHVQPPAGSPALDPALHNAALAQKVFLQLGVFLVQAGQGLDAPPALIIVRPLSELVPVLPDGILVPVGSAALIAAVKVEILAVRPGVAEHAVQHHMDAQPARLGAQVFKVLFGAQHRVHLLVVARVVAVVGAAFENGVQVQNGDPEAFEIGQLHLDPLEGAAEKVQAVIVLDLHRVHPAQGNVVPVLVDQEIFAVRTGPAGPIEAVREDLVHDAFAQVFGRPILRVVDGDLKRPWLRAGGHADAAQTVPGVAVVFPGAVPVFHVEEILADRRLFRHSQADFIAV